MKSSIRVTEPINKPRTRRKSSDFIPIATTGRRSTIHGHHVSNLLSQKQTPTSDVSSRAMKAYRERRASYYKQFGRPTKYKIEGFSNIQQEIMKPIDRFRKIVRLVIMLQHSFKNVVYYASEKGKHNEITSETAMSLKATAAQGTVEDLMFNPEEYKSAFKNTFPKWAKKLTNKPPQERTDDEIRLLIRLLKQLKGFRRYSPQVQCSICKVLKYDIYNRRRVIIRKGHVAQRLYFIYSGSVCVTIDSDDDENSSIFPQQSSDETSVLKRGDYFGELAFLKHFKRGATIVCLEKTEFLSMDKEDFFLSGIDKSFARDLERRVEFLSNHPIFATWPTSRIRSLAEISRIHEYHSEDVIVRDSNNSSWLLFIIKGECDTVRLLDLSACDSYTKYHDRSRRSSPGHRNLPLQNINLARLFSPDSLLKPLLPGDKEEEEEDTAISSSISGIKINKPEAGEEAATRNRTKSAISRTTRCCEDISSDRGYSARESLRSHRNIKDAEKPECHGARNASHDVGVGVGVYLVVDKLKPGQFFGAWSITAQDGEDNTKKPTYKRRLSLISRGCEIIKISKEAFQKLTNNESMETLRQLTRNYPSDDRLCRTYLKLNDWRSYREELVENVLEKKFKEHEISKGVWRTETTRASPVPSPLCSVKPWQPVNSEWEYFPGSGWMASKITHPVIQAGEKRKYRKPSKRKETIVKTKSGAKSGPSIHHPAVTREMCRRVSNITNHSPLPTHHLAASSRYPQNSRPLVGDKLVIAKGSQRALILTHGGLRCNDFIKEFEQSIV